MTSTERGRGGEKQAGPPLKVAQSEALQSINHLYQSVVQSAIQSTIQKSSLGGSIQRVVQLQSLARKATLRLDASIRRSLCQRCYVPLLPGLTSMNRCRTFGPANRAMEVQCRICTLKRRQVATPTKKHHSKGTAVRNRNKAARRLEYKMATYSSAAAASIRPSNAQVAISAKHPKEEPAKEKKWSQRARRRAGRIKAQMLRANSIEDTEDYPLQLVKGASSSKAIPLPRYASRLKGEEEWESSLGTLEMSSHERDAIELLRGGHLLTSGVGRGGFVGQMEADL